LRALVVAAEEMGFGSESGGQLDSHPLALAVLPLLLGGSNMAHQPVWSSGLYVGLVGGEVGAESVVDFCAGRSREKYYYGEVLRVPCGRMVQCLCRAKYTT